MMRSTIAFLLGLAVALTGLRFGVQSTLASGSGQIYVDGAISPLQAVSRIVKPFYVQSMNSAACNAISGRLAACPLTPRLRRSLQRELQWERKHTRGGNGNPFCRCQNPPQTVRITLLQNNGRTALVSTRWIYGSVSSLTLLYVTVHSPSGWRVDNSYCANNPRKDLYHIPIGPCA